MRNPSLPGPIAKDTEGEPAAPADPELLVEILPLDGGLADQTGTEDVAGVGLSALLSHQCPIPLLHLRAHHRNQELGRNRRRIFLLRPHGSLPPRICRLRASRIWTSDR